MTTRSGRRVSPCSATSALSVCGMACPSTSTSPAGRASRQHEVDPRPGGSPGPVGRRSGPPPTPRGPAAAAGRAPGRGRRAPAGSTCTSTGRLRNGPETSTSESHSAWWRAMDMVSTQSDLVILSICLPSVRTLGRRSQDVPVIAPKLLTELACASSRSFAMTRCSWIRSKYRSNHRHTSFRSSRDRSDSLRTLIHITESFPSHVTDLLIL